MDSSPSSRRRLPVGTRFWRDYGIVFAFVALFFALSLMTPAFLTARNMGNILDQAAQIGIIACGATLTIIAGGFDLSAGAIFAVSGVVSALVANTAGPWIGIAVGLLTGVLLGIANGFLITTFHINTFVATLASSLVFRGLALVLTQGLLITVSNPDYSIVGRGVAFEIPLENGDVLAMKWSALLFLGFAVVTSFILARTTFGRFIYAVGDNIEAARLAGIRVNLVRAATFAASGLSGSIAGVIAASRISTGQANVGEGIELSAIAAVVIGGTSILGGEGAIWRTVLGVLLLRLITNGFNILNVEPFYQSIFQGLIILAAVTADALRHRDR